VESAADTVNVVAGSQKEIGMFAAQGGWQNHARPSMFGRGDGQGGVGARNWND